MKGNHFPYFKHPERKKGELWLGNYFPEEIERIRNPDDSRCEFTTLRVGKVPYYPDGSAKKTRFAPKDLRPVFAQEGEFIACEVSTGSGPTLSFPDLDKKYNKFQYETYRGSFFHRLKKSLNYLFGKGNL